MSPQTFQDWLELIATAGDDELWQDFLSWCQAKHPNTPISAMIPPWTLLPFARPSLKHRFSPLLLDWIDNIQLPSIPTVSHAARLACVLDDKQAIETLDDGFLTMLSAWCCFDGSAKLWT